MNVLQSILIKCIMRLDGIHLRQMFVVADVLAGGLTDRDALDSVSAAIIGHMQTMTQDERVMTLKYIHSLKESREVSA